MGQENPDSLMIFCEDKNCIQNAYNGLYKAMTEFMDPYHVRWYGKVNARVKRSSGTIEDCWEVTHIAFNSEGIYKLVVHNPFSNLEKAIPFNDFLELNPDLKEIVEGIGSMIIWQVFSKFENDL
jgi:hypothetical protein